LQPGKFAYCLFDNTWIGCVVLRVKGKLHKNSKDRKIARWNILVWFLLGPENGKFIRGYTRTGKPNTNETKHVIHRFEGEMAVTSLPIIPREYWDARDNGARRRQFEARGKKKLDILDGGPREMIFKGSSLAEEKKQVNWLPMF
jgi:hypothetical protein